MLLGTSQTSEFTRESFETNELVERCRTGDAAAWKELYDTHFDFAYRTARRLGLLDGDVEDVVQESFEVAFQRLHKFQGGRFSTWLFRIVANLVSAKLRRSKVRRVFAELLGSREEEQVPSPESRVGARATLHHVEKILAKLSREKREALALHDIEGLSHEEISVLVGARVETVRTRVFYARREFEAHARAMGVEP